MYKSPQGKEENEIPSVQRNICKYLYEIIDRDIKYKVKEIKCESSMHINKIRVARIKTGNSSHLNSNLA